MVAGVGSDLGDPSLVWVRIPCGIEPRVRPTRCAVVSGHRIPVRGTDPKSTIDEAAERLRAEGV